MNKRRLKTKGRPKARWKSKANAARILERIRSGESLRAICRADDLPVSTVDEWLNKEFSEQYTQACAARADYMFDEILSIADGCDENKDAVAKARLMIDTRKFAMARMAPKKYGDKVEINGKVTHDGTVEFTADDRAIQGITEILNTVVGQRENNGVADTGEK